MPKVLINIKLTLILMLILFVPKIFTAMEPLDNDQIFRFVVTSDIHCKANPEASRKLGQLNQILVDISDPSNAIRAVIIAGDLTDNGKDPEFNTFKKICKTPIQTILKDEPHGGLYVCRGNHDESNGANSTVLKFINKEYGDQKYTFEKAGLHFICCGKFPHNFLIPGIPDTLSWLEEQLKKIGKNKPIVLYFHFNLLGDFSSWWGTDWGNLNLQSAKKDKDAFFNAIKKYKILAIFSGHWHNTYSAIWRNKFRISCVGGSEYAYCTYDSKTENLQIDFKNDKNKTFSWNDMLETDLKEL